MIIKVGDLNIKLLGDAHLGKKFVNGVPLHRRGEREASVWSSFKAGLDASIDFQHPVPENMDADGERLFRFLANGLQPADVHINVGDIFHAAHISSSLVCATADLYLDYARRYRDTDFVIIAGNHDLSKDLEKRSAFHLFEMMVRRVPNIHVLLKPKVIQEIAFFPYDPITPAADLADRLLDAGWEVEAAVGHWDIDMRSDPHNLIPTAELAKHGVLAAFSGHDHTQRTELRDGVTINVVGSMQPYSHSEDPNEVRYVTRSLAEVRRDPGRYHDLCLRIDIPPGERLDFDVDCLQLSTRKLDAEGKPEEGDISVEIDGFSMEKLLDESLAEVDLGIRDLVRDKYVELKGR